MSVPSFLYQKGDDKLFNTSLTYNMPSIPPVFNLDSCVRVHPKRRIRHERLHPKKKDTFKEHEKPLELCLCGRCANAFYNLPDHIIRRSDPDQYFKDKCDYCSQRLGYDYLIYKKMYS